MSDGMRPTRRPAYTPGIVGPTPELHSRNRPGSSTPSGRYYRGNEPTSGTDLAQWRRDWRERAEGWLDDRLNSLTEAERATVAEYAAMMQREAEANGQNPEPLAIEMRALEAYLRSPLSQNTTEEDLEFIGGFFYEGDEDDGAAEWQPGMPFPDTSPDFEGYREGDEMFFLRRMSAEELARLQERMFVAGFIDDYVPGEWRIGETVDGFYNLLAASNASGKPYYETLSEIMFAQRRADAEGSSLGSGRDPRDPAFVAPTRLEPDRDRLEAQVRQYAEQTLGRELDDAEAEHLANALLDIERADFDRRVAAERATQDAQVAGSQRGAPDQAPVAEEYGDDVIASKFESVFDERYGAEMDYKRTTEAGREVAALLEGGFDRLASMVGG
ncbi:MAG: hypothetical protein ACOC02_01390 [Guyparkeria sp.]